VNCEDGYSPIGIGGACEVPHEILLLVNYTVGSDGRQHDEGCDLLTQAFAELFEITPPTVVTVDVQRGISVKLTLGHLTVMRVTEIRSTIRSMAFPKTEENVTILLIQVVAVTSSCLENCETCVKLDHDSCTSCKTGFQIANTTGSMAGGTIITGSCVRIAGPGSSVVRGGQALSDRQTELCYILGSTATVVVVIAVVCFAIRRKVLARPLSTHGQTEASNGNKDDSGAVIAPANRDTGNDDVDEMRSDSENSDSEPALDYSGDGLKDETVSKLASIEAARA
jgi:hypothetical protein